MLRLRAEGQTLHIESPTFLARMEGPTLVSFVHRGAGAEFCRADADRFPLQLCYADGAILDEDRGQQITVRPLSELAARVIVAGNDSDRELFVRLDPPTGDLCVTPGGQSARRGVLSIRWNLAFARDAALVLPCVNGMRVETGRAHPREHRFPWPFEWNAQLVIAERRGISMMLHSQDTAFKFKALDLRRGPDGAATLGFDSEQVGPVHDNRTAGGVEWRLNAYDGGWQVPARRFRDWMEAAYDLAARRAARPAWVDDIAFSFQWATANPALLDALAALHPPARTLIHLAFGWRHHPYDVQYPDYTPNAAARAFMQKAHVMGFKVMPHFNHWACHDRHPVFQRVRDWQIRSVGGNEPMGWYWPPDTHEMTRLAYIHPGLGLWRRALIDAILEVVEILDPPAIFLDQTLWTPNTDNGLAENRTTMEGMLQLHKELDAIRPGLVLAGEGLTEISAQYESFAQAHIFGGWDGALAPEHVEAALPVSAFLWEKHTRLVGYYHLNPYDRDVDAGIEVYRRLGALPTYTGIGISRYLWKNHDLPDTDRERLTRDEPAVSKLLAWAHGRR